MTQLTTKLITMVFIEQPLASPGSTNYVHISLQVYAIFSHIMNPSLTLFPQSSNYVIVLSSSALLFTASSSPADQTLYNP